MRPAIAARPVVSTARGGLTTGAAVRARSDVCRFERGLDEIGVADRVEDQVVRRQGFGGIEEIGDQDGRAVDALVDQEAGRNIASGGRDHEEQPHAAARAVPRKLDEIAVAKALTAVPRRRFVVAALGQNACHALMRLGQVRRARERDLIVRAGRRDIAFVEQHVGEIDPRQGSVGMPCHRLAVARARGAQVSGRVEEGSEIVERAKMRSVLRQHGEIVAPRLVEPAKRGQNPGAANARLERLRLGRQLRVERLEHGFARHCPPLWQIPVSAASRSGELSGGKPSC